MLFLASRALEHEVSGENRLGLLAKLQERDLRPLIRSTRLSSYEQLLPDAARAVEMERLVAALTDSDGPGPYVQGDLFCFDDHLFFLLFGDTAHGAAGLRAGIVYETRTSEPLRKLDSFCQTVSLCLGGDASAERSEDLAVGLTAWRNS
ncbi:MAG TPA: hypothetical protein VJT09_02875, partial [Pyrinomonadaceae bacterium]|nr:hypothetical protein [Pyrinomonadaceae bacterium]